MSEVRVLTLKLTVLRDRESCSGTFCFARFCFCLSCLMFKSKCKYYSYKLTQNAALKLNVSLLLEMSVCSVWDILWMQRLGGNSEGYGPVGL